ncbi:uncharacterized protein BDV17DRAFT_295055 [Aspergillus undulatus]|uniref:uncharacterized protein n=1 Tax=Aspergillus undulatus TaxID=1810928 RepID=UPI003CCD7989
MPSSNITGKCTVCKKLISEICSVKGHIKTLMPPWEHARELSDPSNYSPPTSSTPECPVCMSPIRLTCLTGNHIIPCRSCGESYVYAGCTHTVDINAQASPGAFDWGHKEAMAWLASILHGPGVTASPSESTSSTRIDTPKSKPQTAHACVANFAQTRDATGCPVILGLEGFPEWDQRLNILRSLGRVSWESEESIAVRALIYLQDACETIRKTLNHLKSLDGDEGAPEDTITVLPANRWGLVDATVRNERLNDPDSPWNRWHQREEAGMVRAPSFELVGMESEGGKLTALEGGFARPPPMWNKSGMDPFAGGGESVE